MYRLLQPSSPIVSGRAKLLAALGVTGCCIGGYYVWRRRRWTQDHVEVPPTTGQEGKDLHIALPSETVGKSTDSCETESGSSGVSSLATTPTDEEVHENNDMSSGISSMATTPTEEMVQESNGIALGQEDSSRHESYWKSSIHIRHPQEDVQEHCELGMMLSTERQGEQCRHIIREVSPGGLAYQMGLRDGDWLLKLNEMKVTSWSHQVLVEQLRIIYVQDIYIAVRREEIAEDGDEPDITYTEYHVTVRVEKTGGLHGKILSKEEITVEKNLQVIVHKPQRKQCYVQHTKTDLYLRLDQESNCISMSPLQDGDQSFSIERIMFQAMEDDIQNPHCGDQVLVFLFKGRLNCKNKYMSILGRNQPIGLQSHDELGDHIEELPSADPRFFYHRYTGTGQDTFESTEMPGHFLASDGEKLFLKHLDNSERGLTEDDVHFRVVYPKRQTTV